MSECKTCKYWEMDKEYNCCDTKMGKCLKYSSDYEKAIRQQNNFCFFHEEK